MYGLGSVTTLGVRIGQELNQQLTKAAQTLNKERSYPITKSEIARKILRDFFLGSSYFKSEYEKALKKNVKQSGKIRKKR